jgi:hypothetical protein
VDARRKERAAQDADYRAAQAARAAADAAKARAEAAHEALAAATKAARAAAKVVTHPPAPVRARFLRPLRACLARIPLQHALVLFNPPFVPCMHATPCTLLRMSMAA